jgi:hypothetical protein
MVRQVRLAPCFIATGQPRSKEEHVMLELSYTVYYCIDILSRQNTGFLNQLVEK